MIAESITAGLGSLKAGFDLAKSFNAASSKAAINEAKIALQEHIMAGQQSLAAATDRIRELEQEIVRLEDWSAEKQRYQLKAITPRAYAYVVKPGVDTTDDPHWLCQRCFDAGHKSVLQWAGKMVSPPFISGAFATWRCPKCGSEVHVGRNQSPSDPDDDSEPQPPKPISYGSRGVV